MRLIVVVLGALVGTTLVACKKEAEDQESPPAVASVAKPADHLAPGELLQGKESALGVPLPRAFRVEHSFVDLVYASGEASLDDVTNYLRARVRDGELTKGEAAATFHRVSVPGRPGVVLKIYVKKFGLTGVKVEFRDVTEPVRSDLPDDAARWRAVGVTPDGKPVDPKRFE